MVCIMWCSMYSWLYDLLHNIRTHCIKEVWFKSSVMGVSRAIERFCAEQYKKNASKVCCASIRIFIIGTLQ